VAKGFDIHYWEDRDLSIRARVALSATELASLGEQLELIERVPEAFQKNLSAQMAALPPESLNIWSEAFTDIANSNNLSPRKFLAEISRLAGKNSSFFIQYFRRRRFANQRI
jgi:hypothetical protein